MVAIAPWSATIYVKLLLTMTMLALANVRFLQSYIKFIYPKITKTTTWHTSAFQESSGQFKFNASCAGNVSIWNTYKHPASQSHHISINWLWQQQQQQTQKQKQHLHTATNASMPKLMPIIFNQGYATVNLTWTQNLIDIFVVAANNTEGKKQIQ